MKKKPFNKEFSSLIKELEIKWFEKKLKRINIKGYIEYTPELVGVERMQSDSKLKFEKIFEFGLVAKNIKHKTENGRLKGFWL